MKTRTKYVSNSSSSSFIVPLDLTDEGIACIKLKDSQIESIINFIDFKEDREKLKSYKEYWLTRFVTEYESDAIYNVLDRHSKVAYIDGQMDGTPYDEDEVFGFPKEDDTVFILLPHIVDMVVDKQKLIKILKNKFDKNQKFILNFSNDKIILNINKEV